MAKKEGRGDRILDAESGLGSFRDGRDILMGRIGKDIEAKDGISADDEDGIGDAGEAPIPLHELLSEAESCKDRGNVEFYKGKVLAKHTAGKNLLRDACILYAEGLQTLAKADARLSAERLLLSQQTLLEEDQLRDRSVAADGSEKEVIPSKERSREQESAVPASATSPAPSATSSMGLSLLASLSHRADDVRPSLYLNLAACNLLLQEWTPAIACCTHVLDECCGDALRGLEAETADGGQRDATAAGSGVGLAKGGSSTATRADHAGAHRNGPATASAVEMTEPLPAPAVAPAMTATAVVDAAALAVSGPAPAREQRQRREEEGELRDKDSSRHLPCGEGAESGVILGPHQTDEEEREARRSKGREIAAKGLYRRAAAHSGGGDFPAAREDLVRALRLKPRDGAIGRELRKVEKRLAEDVARESLRRETEEGRRRLLQQQQQQQRPRRKHSAAAAGKAENGSSAEEKSAGGVELAPSAAPRADHAISANSAGDSLDVSAGVGSAAALNEQAGVGGGGQWEERLELKQGPLPHEDKEEGKGGRGEEQEEIQSRRRGDREEEFPTENGGVCRDGLYAWNQSVREVQVCVKIPDWARASDLRVNIRRKRLSVSVIPRNTHGDGDDGKKRAQTDAVSAGAGGSAGGSAGAVVLAGELSRPVQADECLWMVEEDWPGRVLLYLHKELPPPPTTADGREGEEEQGGFEWWASVMEGDPQVDVSTCDAGPRVSNYPEYARRRGARGLWEHQKKSPEERLKEERMRDARRQMEEEAEERQRDLDKALKDPQKAELYRQLRETMPETTISIK